MNDKPFRPRQPHPLGLLLLLALLSGCTSFSGDIHSYNQDITVGDYEGAQTLAAKRMSPNNRNSLLWQLQAGVAARHNMDFSASNQLFDLAEAGIKEHDERTLARSTGQTISSVLVSDTTTPYVPKSYDAIMVNTYKGLNYLALGNADGARVEFNRAVDRQRRAKEFFAREIQKEEQAIAARSQQEQSSEFDVHRTMNNPDLAAALQSQFATTQAYPDFINPFTTYIAGLAAILDRDLNKASHLLKETAGMVPDNPFVAEDYRLVEQTLNTGQPFPPSVWVIFENGSGPTLTELRIDIPVFLVSDQVLYSGLALPALRHGKPAVANLIVSSGEKNQHTVELSNMEQVIHREFEKRYWPIVRRGLLSALIKSSMQYTGQKKGGDLGLIAATIFQIASTRADTRIWTGLPHNFQLARIDKPGDNMVTISAGNHTPIQAHLPDAPFTLIYVTLASSRSKPVMHVYSY